MNKPAHMAPAVEPSTPTCGVGVTGSTAGCVAATSGPPWDRALFLTEFWDDHPGDPRAAKLYEAP